ncbi:MAG: hypothetical protein ACYTG2_06310 [Planctomycetota bacterium]
MSEATQTSWLFSGATKLTAPRDEALAFLDRQEHEDRRLLALRYGYDLDLGSASWVLGLDPSLAHWRLRGSFTEWDGQSEPAELERGVTAVLTSDGAPSEVALRIGERLPARARRRLEAQLSGSRGDEAAQDRRSGLGVGSLVLILIAAGVFMIYGAYNDIDPLRRGRRDVRLGNYTSARAAFAELGALPEARAWTAITWLAEGQFDKAFEIMLDPVVRKYLAQFRPMDEPLEPVEADFESGARLPRGLITLMTPTFVYDPCPEGVLTLVGSALDDPDAVLRTIRIPLPDTRGGMPLARLEYPSNRAPLQAGVYHWWVPGGEQHPASFTLLDAGQRREIQDRAWQRLTHEIPAAARTFLRAHYYLRNHLYMQAGEHFADLALEFTHETYPRRMLAETGAALGVDPSAFLR